MNALIKNPENKFFTFLEKITQVISDQLIEFNVKNSDCITKEVILHPGWEGAEKRYQQLKKYLNENGALQCCIGIYTLLSSIIELKAIESEQADVTLQLSAYVLIVSKSIALEKRIAFHLLTRLLKLINNNRWQLNYTFPANNLKKVDLYGLTVEAKQITGIKGWNPSVQAHAKDLYEETESSVHPNDLSLSLISWEQTLRIKNNFFNTDTETIKKIIIENRVN